MKRGGAGMADADQTITKASLIRQYAAEGLSVSEVAAIRAITSKFRRAFRDGTGVSTAEQNQASVAE